jgi:lysozyme family protein
MTTAFDTAFLRTVGHEGVLSLDPKDRGNWTSGKVGVGELRGTKYGIAAHVHPKLDIANITLEQAKAIYYAEYWNEIKGDAFPQYVAVELFDAAVNHGVFGATLLLQQAVGASQDGDIGDETIGKAKSVAGNIWEFKARFNSVRLEFMTRAPGWASQGKGWARRVANNLKELK